ncbi:hypothetical protein B0H63DRAFT_232156 [Podospora didyma]|uniref:Rap-GAP domain-containing protein n=1 Tax=Podospora didyma TaxID=330526 RepID=A0AAE0NC76_9PEZI|nr:hypothetical protein B0H63DRAFT_232156 [Podospora didyma]
MLRRLASLGHQASEEPMSPSPGDDPQQPPEPKPTGGLAGVFKGLAAAKLTKPSPPLSQQISQPSLASTPSTAPADSSSLATAAARGLPPGQTESFRLLKSGTPSERVNAANSLRQAIADFPLNPVLDIWYAGKDLIDQTKPASVRQAGWQLLTECVKYPSSTDLERREYFHILTTDQAHPDDFHLQLAAVEALTDRGRNVTGFYYDIFPALMRWLGAGYKAVKEARKEAVETKPSKGKSPSLVEEKNLSHLFTFIRDVIKFNFKYASDSVVGSLMDSLLRICMTTNTEADLGSCINVIDALVTFGAIPNAKLKDCIQILATIHFMVASLRKDAWHTLSNIFRSHYGQSTVRILLDVLRTFPTASDKEKERERDKDATKREVFGALSVLKKLLSKSAEKGYPVLSFSLLVEGLDNLSYSNSAKISADILKLINSLFDGADGNLNPVVAEEHWSPIFSVAVQCAAKTSHSMAAASTDSDGSSIRTVTHKDDFRPEDTVAGQLRCLVSRIEMLLVQNRFDFLQRDECMEFFGEVRHALPDSTAELVIGHFKEYRSCFPSEVSWKTNLKFVLEGFYLDRNRRPLTRLQALEVIIEVYDFLCLVQGLVEDDSVLELVKWVLSDLPTENDSLVLQETVTFLVHVAETAGESLFDDILDAFRDVVANDLARFSASASSTPKPGTLSLPDQTVYFANQSLSNVVTKGYVQVFMRSMNKDASKSAKAYTALVHIARSNTCEVDARLTAMKMLFRLRADFRHRVYLLASIQNEALASSLYRTEASLARKLAEDAAQPPRLSRAEQVGASRTSRGISFTQGQPGAPPRSTQIPKAATYQGQRLWSIPDVDALPEAPPSRPSHLLVSQLGADNKSESPECAQVVLNMGSWLEAILSLFHQGCDWEVYSYILVHLPAQLSNHPILENSVSHIQELRRVICEVIKTSSFQEPPPSSGLRRPDVGNCFFHSLVMVLSYHEHFQKMDEDEIVKAFMHGITDKTAKTCIHALSVCCHELPHSVSKNLVTILQKMSQVITQPMVAMHLLEFLACLSRLPSLYSNFREEEYRIVFGICFRYLQYVRDKRYSTRSSYGSEPSTPSAAVASHLDLSSQQSSTDDLPQYVYALAYHVITFWFLAVKMPDRPNHIGWIAKNLFTDVDGSANNEEQAQITIDFMQRVAFSDASDSAEDPLFKEQHFGEMQQKHWIIGNSIVTIRQAKQTGWAEITRRYPSGTSSFAVRVEFPLAPENPAADGPDAMVWQGRFQQGTTIFPSHLLMQLVALPQIYDPASRPIPLPDEDGVTRAIRSFDLNSTVDGHKVGVIYIGEGQTQEVEILANTIGGPEYLEFLRGLGVLTKLKGATFNTQGLDKESDADGKFTYCWRDRVTEIVFHVTTQMPTNLEHDAQCIMKKRHIGNDYVNIVFNDSGLPFRFNTFPSAFNYVYIVITPTPRLSFAAARETASKRLTEGGRPSPFFLVQVMSQPGFPEISPAAEPKMVSLKALPSFVRLLALNASVFSSVWATRAGGEHISSWRNRLREINRLRERYGPKPIPTPSPPPSTLGTLGGGSISAAGGGLMMSQLQQQTALQQQNDGSSRPTSGVRDSFSSLRRSSVATFFTSASTDQASHRSSMVSTATTDNTEIMQVTGAEALVESVDFSKWT